MRNVILAAALVSTLALLLGGCARQGEEEPSAPTVAVSVTSEEEQAGDTPGQAGTGGAARAAGDSETLSLAEVHAQVERLRAEVQRLREEFESARPQRQAQRPTGTGGSGEEEEEEPIAVASAVFTGRVSDVSREAVHVVDDETGATYVLHVTEDTRARRGERRIPVRRIREGSEVRASFELISGETYATELQVLR